MNGPTLDVGELCQGLGYYMTARSDIYLFINICSVLNGG